MHATFERDTVVCPNPELFNRRVIEQKEAVLKEEHQALVVSFIQELVERSLEEIYFGHAGNAYIVTRLPRGFHGLHVVHVMDSKWPAFEELKKTLFSD